MIPARFAPIVFGFIVSGLMSFIVSGIATLRSFDASTGFINMWMNAWWPSWMIAFPVILFVAPIARKLVSKVTRPA